MTRGSSVRTAAALACAITPVVLAQGAANNHLLRMSQEHGFTFSEIGDLGNKAVQTRFNGSPVTTPRGAVDYRYRIMTQEVTIGEYLEFANAAGMHYAELGFSTGHIGGESLQAVSLGGGAVRFFIREPDYSPAEPMRATFAAAAMFANWLHNGQGAGIEAFQNGAYDISTFRPMPGDLAPRGQETHNTGARFWIPTTDELLKAGFWDPNRYGEDEGGWWEQPNASDTQLIPGRPELGGQTNGGSETEWPAGQERPIESGLYPDVQSPWGLIDVSGGAAEWTENLYRPTNLLSSRRIIDGTDARIYGGLLYDNVSVIESSSTGIGAFWAIRLAAVVPSPSGAAVICFGALLAARRRR